MSEDKHVKLNLAEMSPNPVDMKKMFQGVEQPPDYEDSDEWQQAMVQVILLNKDGKRLQVAQRIFAADVDPALLGAIIGHSKRSVSDVYEGIGKHLGMSDLRGFLDFCKAFLATADAETQKGFHASEIAPMKAKSDAKAE